jgi:2-polyprenyl-3-methyl-5-hydroxy-6-metoxy-1,4-benzoquinol methylase
METEIQKRNGEMGVNPTDDSRIKDIFRLLQNQRRQIEQLRQRVTQLEGVLDHCWDNEAGRWLWRNRSERMDPTVPIFDPLRAAFHLARYQFAAEYSRGKQVCDVACGTGYGAAWLAAEGQATRVDGFDCSAETIAYANQKFGSEQVRFYQGQAESLPVSDQTYQLVTSFETIEHLADPERVIDEFARILQPGGLLICSTPNLWPLEIAMHHLQVFSRDSFLELLQRRFQVCSLFNQNSGSDWPYNHGQSAGHLPTTEENHALAECFIAVCELA